MLTGYKQPWLKDYHATPGPMNIPDGATELTIWKLFFTDEVIQLLVDETNRYAQQYIDSHPNLSDNST